MPPFVGAAVKVILVPAQIVVAVELAVTDGVTVALTVITTAALVTEAVVGQVALLVIVTV